MAALVCSVFTYPRGSGALAEKRVLPFTTTASEHNTMPGANDLLAQMSKGQEDHVGSSRSLTEPCFFIVTFFAVGAFLKRKGCKIKDRPPTACPFTRPEKSSQFPMLFYKRFMIKFPIIWLKIISSALHTLINWFLLFF